jgi:hypothetical protein
MTLAASINGGRVLAQSTAYNRAFFMGVTGLTLTLTLSKDGGAFAAASGSVSEISSGWYKIALDTTDTGTLGDLAYHATDGGSNVLDFSDQVAVLPVVLADGVAHGGTPGSSTATIACKQLNATNPTGPAVVAHATGGDGVGLDCAGNGLGAGLQCTGGDSAPGLGCFGGVTAGAGIEAVGQAGHGIEGVSTGGNGAGLSLTGQGTGHDLNLAGDGKLWDSAAGKPASVRLADATDHGGAPGSSTATIACAQLNATNPSGIAFVMSGATIGCSMNADQSPGSGSGWEVTGKGSGAGLIIQGGSSGGTAVQAYGFGGGNALDLEAFGGGVGVYLYGSGAGNQALLLQTESGDAVYLNPTGGHGLTAAGDGAGKHDVNLAGDGLVGGSIVQTSDLAAVPAAAASLADALSWLHMLARNKVTQTATTETVYKDDGTTAAATSTKADNGTTFTRGEYA